MRFLSLILLLTICITGHAQLNENSTVNEIINAIQRATDSINLKMNGSRKSNFKSQSHQNIYQLKIVLANQLPRLSKVPNTDTLYKSSLLANYIALINYQPNEQQLFADLTSDFQTKLQSINLGHTNAELMDIPVTVVTYDSSLNEISGYTVHWNFWVNRQNTKPRGSFTEFTNPKSQGFLKPGLYDVWVQKVGEERKYPIKREKQMIVLVGNETFKKITLVVKP